MEKWLVDIPDNYRNRLEIRMQGLSLSVLIVVANPDTIAKAMAQSYQWTIALCANTALNLSGL